MHKVHKAKKKKNQKSNLQMALECAADLQKRLVLFNPSTSVGVLLYNTVSAHCWTISTKESLRGEWASFGADEQQGNVAHQSQVGKARRCLPYVATMPPQAQIATVRNRVSGAGRL